MFSSLITELISDRSSSDVKDIDIWKFKSEEPNLEHLKFHVQFIFY